MSKLSRSDNQTKWFEVVDAYEKGELTKDQFCQEQNIKKATLDYWIRKSRYQSEQTPNANLGFANLLPKNLGNNEIRLHFGGVDIYLPIQTNPALLKMLIQGLTQ